MDEATRRVRQTAKDASSNSEPADNEFLTSMRWDENDMLVPLDEQTLDERAAGVWESRRRDTD
jgi:hypothetical protein